MIGWLLKKVSAPQIARPADEATRAVSPEACALWHDIDRALSQTPRLSDEGRKHQSKGDK